MTKKDQQLCVSIVAGVLLSAKSVDDEDVNRSERHQPLFKDSVAEPAATVGEE